MPDKRAEFLEKIKAQDLTPLLSKYRIKSVEFVLELENDGHDYNYPGLALQ